jgi:hypothetical protein
LFTAVYFAENWQSDLTIDGGGRGDAGRCELDVYLGFHEVEPAAVTNSSGLGQTRETAVLHQSDLVILHQAGPAARTRQLLAASSHPSLNSGIPLLICP